MSVAFPLARYGTSPSDVLKQCCHFGMNPINTSTPKTRRSDATLNDSKQLQEVLNHKDVRKSSGVTNSSEDTQYKKAESDMVGISDPMSAVKVAASTTTMPTTTIVTTTAMATGLLHSTISVQMGCTVSTTASAVTTTIITTNGDDGEGKRKQLMDDENRETCKSPKRRIVESPRGDPVLTLAGDNSDLKDMIKTMFGKVVEMEATIGNINNTVAAIQTQNRIWNSRFEKIRQECNDLKESVEMAHNLIRDEVTNRDVAITEVREQVKQQGAAQVNVIQSLKTHSTSIRSLSDNVKAVNGRMDKILEEQSCLKQPVNELKKKVDEVLGETSFPIKKTIVGQSVWYKEGEDLNKIAELIINKTLELPHVKITRVERKTGFDSGFGLIKMELETEGMVKEVMRNKKKLKSARAKELRDIFLRQSKSPEMLLAERNQDVILREIRVRDNYIWVTHGLSDQKRQSLCQ